MSANWRSSLLSLVESSVTQQLLKQFWTDWDAAGGGPCAGLRTKAMSALQGPSADLHKLWFAADALQELCWEKLHTGHWMDVKVAWRDAYTLYTLLAVIARIAVSSEPAAAGETQPQQKQSQQNHMHQQQIQSTQGEAAAGQAPSAQRAVESAASITRSKQQQQQHGDLLLEALKQLDLAAMMGGPRFRSLLDQAISMIDHQLQQGAVSQIGTSTATVDHTVKAGLAGGSRILTLSTGGAVPEEGLVMPSAKRQHTEQAADEVGEGDWSSVHSLRAAADLSLLPSGSLTATSAVVPMEYCPSIEQFMMKYMLADGGPVPVVIKGAMEHWPALTRWQDLKYLSKVAGRRTVPVEVGQHYLQDGWGTSLMTLDEFIDKHIAAKAAPASGIATSTASPPPEQGPQHQLGYLAQHQLFEQVPALAADVSVPDYCMLGERGVSSINAWFGPCGTVTPLHQDPENNFLAQVVGYKYVRLYDPRYTQQLYPHEEGMHTNTSRVDVQAVDEALFPEFSSVAYQDVLLEPGCMLYMPPKWWHFIKSASVSFSVSFWWS